MLKTYLRPIVGTGLVATLTAVWVYQTLNGGNPDSLLTLIVFLAALASVVYMFGKGTVQTALNVLESLQGGGGNDSE